jgi:putative ABC transport system permease protein
LLAGQAIVGSSIDLENANTSLHLLGYDLEVAGRLVSTGTDIDQTIFVSFETAEQLALAISQQPRPREFSFDRISALMVEIQLGYRAEEVAVRILEGIPGVVPLETPDLFQAERGHMIGVLRTLLSILVGVWGLAVVFIGLVFAIVVNDRERDIGVLRALGSPGRFIQKALLLEGILIAAVGGLAGVLLTSLVLYTLGDRLARAISLPLVLPTPAGLASLSILGQLLTVGSVALAAYLPAWLISRKEVAVVMRT